ncbi:CRTAC1 family protein [Oricola sp.]|uniref:CRTAC1 family protein n=1 Tax=Oricola sp. TaxID=1979950 RepID=UPI0025DF2ECC|nr:CRTAC1 family protein [Oricola sp.]MCI5076351.1 CRTAC1 family protein [Oricola sp.]
MTRLSFALCLTGLVLTAPATAEDGPADLPMDVPVMVEEALAAGIDHQYTGPWEYFVGGGAAAFDCNGDRMPDLAFAGGTSRASLYVNRSAIGGELQFAEKPDALPEDARDHVTGLYPLDIDNDGYRDLVVLRVGENILLKGGPDCSFTEANRAFAFDGGRAWSTAFAATFEPHLPFPTLAFGNYVDRSAPGSPWGTCHDNVLLRPQGPGGERPDYSEPNVLTPGYCALSMLFTDWNRSGEPALRITNDRQYYREGQEQLWRVSPDRPPRPYRRSDGWRRVQIWGMGIAEADLNADGFPEYALTSMGDTKLQTLDDEAEHDRPVYRDIAFDNGATAHRPYTGEDLKPSTGWHAEFSDFNNDGRLDLFIAKGNVQQMQDFAAYDPDNLLLGKAEGGFTEAGDKAGIALPRRGRGAAVADFNMDGMLDLAVVNREAPVSLFRNAGGRTETGTRPMGNWLEIELRQNGVNRDAIGATVTVKSGNETRTRKLRVGGGHASGSAGFVHVGTGTAERAQIRVQWPDGEWSAPFRVFANNFVVIERGATSAQYWYPVE